MKPFKANGREIKLQSPDEVVKLMQMGANYTKKMQALQPNLKILRMLENNQLLNEDKLSHLIDISKGDKNAIAKFVKDIGIDPMDIDTEDAVQYRAGNHRVSDSEISFQNVVDEALSTDAGKWMIVQMQDNWDQASKTEIFKEPRLIQVLTQQKADGIYDQIASEVERLKMLGHPQIAPLPFINAYELVGKEMAKAGTLKTPQKGNISHSTQQNSGVAEISRAPAPSNPRKTVKNGDKAKAASPSASGSKKAQQGFNPLAVSDEEFLKMYNLKV